MNWPWPSTYLSLFPIDSARGKTIFFTTSCTCCASTLIVSRRSGFIANTLALGSVLGKLHKAIWHLSFKTSYLCCGRLHWLYYILRTGPLFAWMIEHTIIVKCDFLYNEHNIPPHVQGIYMRKTKNNLPLAYFIWEDVAFSKSISAWGLVLHLIKRTTDF